jgi:hypothetical protein
VILRQSAAAPGVLAYRMSYAGEHLFIAFNTAETETLLDNVATSLPAGSALHGVYAIDGTAPEVMVGTAGRFSLRLPPRAGYVWRAGHEAVAQPVDGFPILLDRINSRLQSGNFQVAGKAPPGKRVAIVVDGNLAHATHATADAAGRWMASIDTSRMFEPTVLHSLAACIADEKGALIAVSGSQDFRVLQKWVTLAQIEDPAGDDRGPHGSYVYPTDTSWGANRQMDIRRIKVSGAGGALRVDLTMKKVTATWNPQNGFDHVAFILYIDIPGRRPSHTFMPLQNTSLPAGMSWNYRLRAHGWSNTLFSADAASPDSEGTPVTPGADIRVDVIANTISFLIPAVSMGSPPSFSGARLYVTTWDYDGGYRPLGATATGHSMGGGSAGDPLIMDDSPVIVLP